MTNTTKDFFLATNISFQQKKVYFETITYLISNIMPKLLSNRIIKLFLSKILTEKIENMYIYITDVLSK